MPSCWGRHQRPQEWSLSGQFGLQNSRCPPPLPPPPPALPCLGPCAEPAHRVRPMLPSYLLQISFDFEVPYIKEYQKEGLT